MKIKLTIAEINKAKVPTDKTEIKLWDSDVGGLYLRIAASGARRWYYRYRNDNGEVKPFKIGDYPTLSIDAARKATKIHAGQVAKGHDPAQVRHEKRRYEKATLRTLLAVDGPFERNCRDRHLVNTKVMLSCLRRGLVKLMNTDVAKITRLDFVAAIDALRDQPGAATMLRKTTRSFLEWTTNSGLTPHNVLAGWRAPPKSRAQRLQEAAKRRALDDQDIVKVWRAAETCGSFGAMVRFSLLTAMRRGELANLHWADVAADRVLLGAQMTKTGVAHQVPITSLMREVLASLPRGTSPYVFPSEVTGRAMRGWAPLQAKLVAAADIGPFKIHDLRRTCRTLMTRCGVAEPVAELSIGHVKAALVGLYDLAEQWDARRDAFTRVSDHIGKLVTTEPAKVVRGRIPKR